ncbi:MAG: chemotaxis response regulator protein-glutamate methylesterase [Acidobacteria bacterium]|nr:MAG: chemotaxis response regulator protein-glutamate methylesterase [Acidobacteriota bacterium]
MPVNVATSPSEVRVLIVDDSVVVRDILKRMLESDPAIRVVGMAANGGEAVELTAQLRPDLVTMDLVMPGMNGMEATERIMAFHPTPVLFFSSYFDREGMYSRLDALAAGALDIIEKPTLMPDSRWEALAAALIEKVKVLAQVPVVTHMHGGQVFTRPRARARVAAVTSPAVDVVAIGASSGGPRVLEEILSALPPAYALAVIIVQHMAEGFMPGLLQWLQQRCPLPVRVAEEGEVILPRRVLFAPDWAHLVVQPEGRVHLSAGDPVSGHRPSVDVTFTSLAKVYGTRAAGMLLTGMGSDGAAGLLAIRQAGGATLVQNEDSCVVFGMPRAAIELGAAQHVLPPSGLIRSLKAFHGERLRALTQ